MEIEVLVKDLKRCMSAGFSLAPYIFSRFMLIDEKSRTHGAYSDSNHLTFYYYLGKILKKNKLLEVGFGLGINSGFYITGNPDLDKFVAFQTKSEQFYSGRIGIKNIKNILKKQFDFYEGDLLKTNLNSEFNLIIFNEKHSYDTCRSYFDYLWEYLELDGFLVVGNLSIDKNLNKAFFDFCKTKNREGVLVDTRYGNGIVKK